MCSDFVQERFHNTSPSDFERMFIKTANSETKVEEARGESRGRAPCLFRNVIEKKQAMLGCVNSLRSKSHSDRVSQGC